MDEQQEFLGRGWAFPPGFSEGGGEVEMVAGVADIHESLRILVATAPGERVMQESYGCGLNSVMFEEMDQGLLNSITGLVTDAIIDHEPRIDLESVDVKESDLEAGLLLISIQYMVRGVNNRYNMVFPFYLKEASAAP